MKVLAAVLMMLAATSGLAVEAVREGMEAPERVVGRAMEALEARGIASNRVAPTMVMKDEAGNKHVRFNQMINGVPVFGRFLVTHELRQRGFAVDGDLVATGYPVSTEPRLSAAQAVANAIVDFGGDGVGSARLVLLPRDGVMVLAYDVDVKNTVGVEVDEPRRERMFIDAHTGATLERFNNLMTAKPGTGGGGGGTVTATVGTGYGFFAGAVTTLAIASDGTNFLMHDVPNNGKTYDFANGSCNVFGCGTKTGTLYTSADNVFGTNGILSERQSIGVDAHFFAQKTLAYFSSTFGRNGIDNNNNKNLAMGHMVSRTHYGRGYNNAFWDGASMTYGDGDGTTRNPYDAIDVVGHEMTHGITERTSDLVYQNESGAANESYSDIFGAVIEFKTGPIVGYGPKTYVADWFIGEDIYKVQDGTKAIRNMADPHQQGDPDHYSERYTGTDDSGGVHINSGIQNKVFYLLAEGGTHHLGGTVSAIGLDQAAAVAYNALTVYTTNSNATYAQTAKAWVTAANNLYGASVASTVQSAWLACGVTPAP